MAHNIDGAGNSAGESTGWALDSDGTWTVGANAFTTSILSKLVGLGGYVWDLTAATTGAAYIGLTDNLASALAIKVGSTAYLTFKSTTNAARVVLGKTLRFAPATTVTIAANHTLVVGTAGANQTQFAGNVFLLVNTSGSDATTLTLPAYSVLSDDLLVFANPGANSVVLKDSGGSTICTIASGKAAMVFNNGTNGLALLGA